MSEQPDNSKTAAFRRKRRDYMRARRARKSTGSQLRKESWEQFLKRRGEKYAIATPHAVLPDNALLTVYAAAVLPPGTRQERWMAYVWRGLPYSIQKEFSHQ